MRIQNKKEKKTHVFSHSSYRKLSQEIVYKDQVAAMNSGNNDIHSHQHREKMLDSFDLRPPAAYIFLMDHKLEDVSHFSFVPFFFFQHFCFLYSIACSGKKKKKKVLETSLL